MIKVPKHDWHLIYTERGEVCRCSKCGLEVLSHLLFLKIHTMCEETLVEGVIHEQHT